MDPYRLIRRFEKVKRCQVLRLFENATVALSCATDWILVVGQWPVLGLWLVTNSVLLLDEAAGQNATGLGKMFRIWASEREVTY